MAKYMILFSSSISASDQMANSTPEQVQASMADWMKWHEEANKTCKVEWGLPLQAVSRISNDGISESDNHASGYATIEGDKDAIVEMLKSHPHLHLPEASIDLLEMIHMPGMDS